MADELTRCQARTGVAGGLACGLTEGHAPPGDDPGVARTRHIDPATGMPWHTDPGGAIVIGPPYPAAVPRACGSGYIWQTPPGAIELLCDTGGRHDRHRDPRTGWHWSTGDGLLTVEASPGYRPGP